MLDTNKSKEDTTVRRKKFWKFWLLMLFINIGFIAVVARLFTIQIIKGDEYRAKAKRQHESKVTLSAQRGNIYDRNGKLLASTVQSVSVAVDPTVLSKKAAVCRALAEDLGLSSDRFMQKINAAKGSFVWLARGIMPDRLISIRGIKDRGLLLIEEPTRHYYYGSSASQIIGCTDVDNKGLSGIELGWDSALKGRSGYMIMNRDGRGRLRPSADLPIIDAIHGYSIQLTIDIELQNIVEFELMQGVVNSGAHSGTAIALDPHTGEVLAMASSPGFNPNISSTFSANGMRNRGITDVYEPGSTFKMVTAAAALEENIVNVNDTLNGFNGELHISDYVIKDTHPLGKVTFREAMEHSSNIIMSTVATKIPDYKFYKYIRDFGFGIAGGIDIPGEVPGKIQKPDQFNSTAKRYMGFGYGLLASPMQMVNSYAAIANRGTMMRPYVVKSVFDGNGEEILKVKPEKIRRVISEKTSDIIKDLLCGVVDHGTGVEAKIPGLKVAGKTGTSQQLVQGIYSKADYTASFVGFYPAENPRIAVIVVLDKPRTSYYGGSVAAPIFKNIALRWVSVSPKTMIPFITKQNNYSDTVYVPQLKGLSIDDAELTIKKMGLRYSADKGAGVVSAQSPEAGSRVIKGFEIKLGLLYKNEKEIKADSLNPGRPVVKGLSVRRAVTILQNAGIRARIVGSGIVKKQEWIYNSKKQLICVLSCE